MKKIFYNTLGIILLFICSFMFVSCDAITAQNINTDSFSGINSNPGIDGGELGPGGTNGWPGGNGSQRKNNRPEVNDNNGIKHSPDMPTDDRNNKNLIDQMDNANLIGKITSKDNTSVTIELLEQGINNKGSNSNDDKQDIKDVQINNINDNTATTSDTSNNMQPQKDFTGNMPEINFTGTYKTLTVNDDVLITQIAGMRSKNKASKSEITISDLKEGQIIMVWYKENTETVEKISIVKF